MLTSINVRLPPTYPKIVFLNINYMGRKINKRIHSKCLNGSSLGSYSFYPVCVPLRVLCCRSNEGISQLSETKEKHWFNEPAFDAVHQVIS